MSTPPDATDTALPSLTRLQADLGQTYRLTDAKGDSFEAVLSHVREAPAMSRRYQCYAAQFVLDERRPQAVYAVRAGANEWPLLLTPIGPDEHGRPTLEAVFHIKRPTTEELQHESGVVDASTSRQ
jgi:hypothetical protein